MSSSEFHILPTAAPSDDHSLLRWISGDSDNHNTLGSLDQAFDHSIPPFGYIDGGLPMFDDNPFPSQMMQPLPLAAEEAEDHHSKRHNSGQTTNIVEDAVVVQHLYKAAEALSAGNLPQAQQILARLNHHIIGSSSSAALHRAASHFATALLRLDAATPSPFDAVFKMAAYKLFSEVSPQTHFLNFTATQVLLDSLSAATPSIHILDFDIGFGAHWASFLHDLPLPRPSVTITALASSASHHPLLRHTLSRFAADLSVPFHLHLLDDPSALPPRSHASDLVAAVNLPLWDSSPALLRLLNHLSPDLVLSADPTADLPFPHRVVRELHSHAALLDSLDAAGAPPDALDMIHKFLLQPRIDTSLRRRHSDTASAAGLVPAPLSSLAETQAECVVKRAPVRGFHVEKRSQSSLSLCWHCRELVSVSAWRRRC